MQNCCGQKRKPAPAKPPKPERVLMQKILASETRNTPGICAELELENIPCGFTPPFTLEKLCPGSAQPWWRPSPESADQRRVRICIFIPVACLFRDCAGKCFYAQGTLSLTESISRCLYPECSWKQQLVIVPSLMLAQCTTICGEAAVKVKVDLCLELYLITKEPCGMKKTPPPCPDRPLYPEMQEGCCERKYCTNHFVRW